ncbi:MAG: tRNA (5-methylaminomethyl-2-thiouridine)(34)-methyltransferase MnmD, partial [Hydrogenophilaceae bacterium]|nr:tRNA (5-methylaminomethyl-2-thiouridine)(34)-methyltransferase MnmD [Hydrogenophilaceae bacterium]
MPRLPDAPDLEWTDEGTPRARAFGDVYYSRGGGLAETQAVFLAGCGLPGAWEGRRLFTILELGFGAGLNALAVWRLWRARRSPPSLLHMISIEASPMSAADAARAHAAFPEISDLSAALVARWPAHAFGAQRLWFEADGFALTVVHGDARKVLARLEAQADAIFLDGFAPDRNPAMWSDEAMAAAARCAAPGARLASYSVAGAVRR